jgi:hypothetical protein
VGGKSACFKTSPFNRQEIWPTQQRCLGQAVKNISLSTEGKLLLYEAVFKPIWTYGTQIWGTGSSSNIEILPRFQSKTVRSILSPPWYINNHRIHDDLQMITVLNEIKKWNNNYFKKLETYTNALAVTY